MTPAPIVLGVNVRMLGHALLGSLVGAVAYPELWWFIFGETAPWRLFAAFVGGVAGLDYYVRYVRPRERA